MYVEKGGEEEIRGLERSNNSCMSLSLAERQRMLNKDFICIRDVTTIGSMYVGQLS